jgi:sugar lactone lactonase YvrE
VACGLTFAPDGTLFVGDRSGTIFRVDRDGHAATFASLPPSVAAFHLAIGPDLALYVTGPTLASYDALYRVDAGGEVTTRHAAFGRPQGLAFDSRGVLYVVDALAGAAGLYRVDVTQSQPEPVCVLSAPALIGVAFDPLGGIAVLYFSLSEELWNVKAGEDAPMSAKWVAAVVLLSWAGVIICGRLLPYV